MSIRPYLVNLLCAALLCAALASQARPKSTVAAPSRTQTQSSTPVVTGVSPTEASVGSSITLSFSGANLVGRAMSLSFSPSTGITVSKLTYVSPQQITAELSIAANAQLGSRQINLIDGDRNLHVSEQLTLTQPAQSQNCGPATFAAASCGPGNQPALRGFTPYQGTQGSTVTLTVTGANFTSPSSIQLTPSAGLTIQSTRVVNSNQIEAQVVIAPNASLGARAVSILTGKQQRLNAANTFTVVSAAAQQKPMQILRVVPNQVAPGSQNVELTLIGSNFVPGTQVTFTIGAGVPAAVFATGPARYMDSTEMQVTVNVLLSALPGGRDINLQAPGAATTLTTAQLRESSAANGLTSAGGSTSVIGKGMLNVMAPVVTGPPTVLKIAPITLQKFTQGVIKLDAPLGPFTQSDEYTNYTAPPVLNDSVVFQWHELNPGLADYYELRVYGRDGKTLIATERINPVRMLAFGAPGGFINSLPTYYRPDPAFLKQVLAPHLYQHGFYNADAGLPPDQMSALLSQGDLEWEVVGFHTYNKNGVTKTPVLLTGMVRNGQSAPSPTMPQSSQSTAQAAGDTVDLQVETSDRWPLKAPKDPTGMGCSGSGYTTGNLNVQNFSRSSNNDPNNYIGDLFALGGTVDLSHSPYKVDYTFQTYVPKGDNCGNQCLIKDIADVDASNVYVDWGDGTVEPLVAPPASANQNSWDPSMPLVLPTNNTSPMNHKYQSTGSFTIRLFQLSNDDLQNVSVNAVSASVDGATTPFLRTALLNKMSSNGSMSGGNLTQTSMQLNLNGLLAGAKQNNAAATTAATDAYMLYCSQVNITVPEDLAADGPLHLKSIDDPDFGSYDVSANKFPIPVKEPGTHISLEMKKTGTPTEHQQSISVDHGLLPNQPTVQPAAICSSCDEGMLATTAIHFYGHGPALVTWSVDGIQTQQTIELGPSTPRTNLTRQGYTTVYVMGIPVEIPLPEPPIIIDTSKPIDSPELHHQPLGDHAVMVSADVLPQPSLPNLSIPVNRAVSSLMPASLASSTSSGNAPQQSAPNLQEAQTLLNSLNAPPGSNLPPLKVGVLSASNKPVGGLNAVQYVNGALASTIQQLSNPQPDSHVASNTKIYEVVASNPNAPCNFLFPVQSGGAFTITGIQNHVTGQNGVYNGTGSLIIKMANGSSGGYDQYAPIPIEIKNWSVPDGQHVQTGSIDVAPNLQLQASVPGVTGSIVHLAGSAGAQLNATLNLTLADDTLRIASSNQPVQWNGVTAELKASGDWTKDGLALPTSLIGWSDFTMQTSSARVDLSHTAGDAPSEPICGPLKAADWVGVRFPSLTITPYTFNLVSGNSIQQTVPDWGVVGNGLCGTLKTGQFSTQLGQGSVSFQSIVATAFNGTFTANYNGMDIHVPWLNIDLTGNATLLSGGGNQANISFPLNTATPNVTRSFGNFSFTASGFKFLSEPFGWAVQTNSTFTYAAGNVPFATYNQTFFFGMDGRGYFQNGAQSADIPLGGSSHLNKIPVDLTSVHLTAPNTGPQVLTALFNTSVHLSEVMPAQTVAVNYSVNQSGTSYSTTGPSFTPFTLDVPYPPGSNNPSAEAKIHPVYSANSSSGSSGSNNTPNDVVSGSVDLSELGGPPITGEFRLGYMGGHDYWLTRISYPLAPTGIPIISVPPVMNLFRVNGGMGHNFPISAFQDQNSLESQTPQIDNSFLFDAGVRLGMPDQFTYTLDGDLTIEATGSTPGARLNFHSWILKPPDNGNGDFQGYLQYAGNNFDARAWGTMNLLDGVYQLSLGSGPNDAAIDIHFGPSGPWHIDAGKKNGPRITGTFLGMSSNMYIMLSGDGLSLGGGENINLTAGSDSSISAYIRGDVDIGVTITPQPHISGDFSASVSAGACVDNVCVNAGVSAQIHAEALPVDLEGSATLGLPFGASVTISVHL